MKKSLVLIISITIISIFLIGFLFSPQNANLSYWFPYMWLSLLVYLNWFLSIKMFDNKTRKTIFGVLPASILILNLVSLFSVTLMFFASYANLLLNPLHITLQIIITSGTSVSLLFFNSISIISAIKSNDSYINKNHAIKILSKVSIKLSEENKDLINIILKYIEYDLPHDSKLIKNTNWINFTNSIKKEKDFSDEDIVNWQRILKEIINHEMC